MSGVGRKLPAPVAVAPRAAAAPERTAASAAVPAMPDDGFDAEPAPRVRRLSLEDREVARLLLTFLRTGRL